MIRLWNFQWELRAKEFAGISILGIERAWTGVINKGINPETGMVIKKKMETWLANPGNQVLEVPLKTTKVTYCILSPN